MANLTRRLKKWQTFNVSNCPTDFGDHDINVWPSHSADARLDFISDVWNDLHSVAQVLSPPFLCNHRRIHLPGCHVRRAVQISIKKTFVVSDIKIGFGPVIGHKYFTMLKRIHGSRVNVQVRIKLLHCYAQTPRCKQIAQ